jgi:hypothetical protein
MILLHFIPNYSWGNINSIHIYNKNCLKRKVQDKQQSNYYINHNSANHVNIKFFNNKYTNKKQRNNNYK